MLTTNDAPIDPNNLQDAIQQYYPSLSKRLKQLARYLLENPDRIVLCTVAELSSEAEVPPSTVIRFANALGFSGFSEMRRAVRSQLHYTGSYAERVQLVEVTGGNNGNSLSNVVQATCTSLQSLEQNVQENDLLRVVNMIQQADTVYIMGVRRAHPVATYLAYGLWQLDRRCVLMGSKGGLHQEEASGFRRTDLVILVSYYPYGEETLWMHEHARLRGARVITITDNEVSPLAQDADQALFTKDAEITGVRGLASSMCLAQSLILSLAQRSSS